MIALMALWFGRHAGLPSDGGYFYLCPACYHECIDPHLSDVLQTLLDQHPFLHRLTRESRESREDREGRVAGREDRAADRGDHPVEGAPGASASADSPPIDGLPAA